MTQQTVEVLVGASLPTRIRPSKVARALQCLVDLGVRCKLLAVVVGERFHPWGIGPKAFNDGLAYQLRGFVGHLGNNGVSTLALNHRHNSSLVIGSNDGVALPVADLLSGFNVSGSLTQGTPVRDLSPSVSATGVALSLLLLTAQVLPQLAASGFVCVNTLIKRFMAHRQFSSDLLRAPLHTEQVLGLLDHPGRHSGGVSALLTALGCQLAGLLGAVPFKSTVTRKLPADGRFVSIQQLRYLRLTVSGIHKNVDLISFHLAEMFVIYGQLRLAGQKALNAKHSQPPALTLIKVALRP